MQYLVFCSKVGQERNDDTPNRLYFLTFKTPLRLIYIFFNYYIEDDSY